MTQMERSTAFIAAVVGAAAVTQVFATQLTSQVFRTDSSGHTFASPVTLTWFSMHALLLLALPWLWERWSERRANNNKRGGASSSSGAPHPRAVNAASYASTLTAAAPATECLSMATMREGEDEDKKDAVAQHSLSPLHQWSSSTSSHHAPLLHLQPFEAAVARAHPVLSSLQGVWRLVFLYMLYVAANVSYVKALQGLPPALVSAIFCAAPGFVLVLSWPVLGRAIQRVEVASVALGLGGILLITQPWRTSSSPDKGSSGGGMNALYATISPAASAVYKVFFAKFYSDVSWQYVGSRLGGLAVVNLTIGTLLVVAYVSVGGEPDPTSTSASDIPWKWIIPSNAASISFNFLVNFGVTITFPLFVSVASLMSTAANLVIDATVGGGGESIGALEVVGLFMVLSSLVVLLVSVWRRRRSEAATRMSMLDVEDDTAGVVRVGSNNFRGES